MSIPTAIYLRVSTKAQDTRSQEAELKRWAAGNDVPWSESLYSDKFTGTSMDRPGFNLMMGDVRGGLIKRIVVWRLDRLGRTAKGLITLFDDLQRYNVNLVSLRDNLDLSTPTGRLMANMVASFAAYETEVRSERQTAGIAAAKAAGVTWGGATNTGKRLKVKPEQEEMVRELKGRGQGVSAIARATGLSRPTVYTLIKPHDADGGFDGGPGGESTQPAPGQVPAASEPALFAVSVGGKPFYVVRAADAGEARLIARGSLGAGTTAIRARPVNAIPVGYRCMPTHEAATALLAGIAGERSAGRA